MRVYRVTLLLLLSLFAFTTSDNLAQARRVNLTIENRSSREIHRLHLAVSGDKSWGPDLLGDRTLRPGELFPLSGLQPAYYNVLFIDANNNECVLSNLPVFQSQSWPLTDEWLNRFCRRRN